jgi:ABC-type antimicrobial peptide transport system permease subunit
VALLVGLGIATGAGLSLWAAKFMAASSLIYGLKPRDPGTLLTAALVLTAIGAIAGYLPARRASRIDPARVLREG